MGHISIDIDEIIKSKNFKKLITKIGNKDHALGQIVIALMTAKEFRRNIIPSSIWKIANFSDHLVSCKFGSRLKNGVKIKNLSKD